MNRRTVPFVISALLLCFSCLLPLGCGGSSSASTEPANNPVPTISALSIDNVLIGSEDLSLTITGTNFITGTKAFFGSDLLTATSVTATDMKVVIPKTLLTTAKIISITASNPTPGGGTSNALKFTIKNPLPTLTALSATTAYIGSPDLTLNLTGKGFATGAKVHFGSNDLTPTAVADTQVSIVVPAALLASTGIVPISVSNVEPGGGASSALDFTIGYPLPTITSFTVSSTLVNSTSFTLEIDGSGFTSGTRIYFGADELTPSAMTASHITALVPDALLTTARVIPVTASNPQPLGGTSNSLDFGVHNPVPVITALSINTAEAGPETDLALEVTGTNFVSGATVNFGSHQLTPASPGSTKLDVMIPVAALSIGGEMSVTVSNPGPGGGVSNTVKFTVNNPVPQLNALSQSEATAGDSAFELLLIGAKFVSTTTVDFGGTTLTPSQVSAGEIVVNVPEAAFATGGVIQVKAVSPGPGGGPSASINFTINNPLPAITSASPTSITNTGSDVVVNLTGSNFVSTSTVAAGADSAASSWVSKSELKVTLPAALVATGATTGSLSIIVSNPDPAGGKSNAFSLIVHNKAALAWQTVANGATALPNTKSTTLFSTFGPASINTGGIAVFKGQSAVTTTGSEESSSTTGIYSVDLNTGTVARIADITMLVPEPNTITYGSTKAKFGSFPSFARIDQNSTIAGFAATHPPVVTLTSGGRVGSAGLYANPAGTLDTGVGLFAQDPYTYFQVPDMPAGTVFGAFPASPSMVNGSTIVFKGDFLNGTAVAMGVYYRDLVAEGGASPVSLIASTYSTQIPAKTVKFGYIAAPSAVDNTAVFVGYDKVDAPTAGGIYSAPISSPSALTPLVTIGAPVPGEAATFTRFGDAVSFDGRYVGFWGAWGTETTTKHVTCSTISDPAMSAYCLTIFPNGHDAQVPVHQGMFVYDTTTDTLKAIAKTGSEFSDFAYWVFVGNLPEEGAPTDVGGGSGEEEVEVPLEPPAFVLSPNIAVAGQGETSYQVVFKASTGTVDGIYTVLAPDNTVIETVLDTTMAGTVVDPGAVSTSIIKNLDLEREGLRGSWLAIGSTLLDSATKAASAGVYATSVSTQ